MEVKDVIFISSTGVTERFIRKNKKIRMSTYDEIFDKKNLLEEITVRYENERRHKDNRSFQCF